MSFSVIPVRFKVMRKIIEYTLLSLDGVFEDPVSWNFMDYRDDAYMRDGLALLLACDAMLFGRNSYESSARIWPERAIRHPWAARLNEMKKYVFSSEIEGADWNNTTIIRGDVATEVAKLKQQEGRNLLVLGHTLLGESLLRDKLLDVIDVSIHPVIVGTGKQFFRDGQSAKLKLVATKSFSNIVKLSYEPQY
jgi:dihydrofolate reductase